MSDETQTEQPPESPSPQPSPQPGAYQKYSSGDYEVESNIRTAEEIRQNFEEAEPENKDAPQKTPEEQKAEDTSKAAAKLGERSAEARKEKGEEKPQEKAEKPEKAEEKTEEKTEKAEKPKPRKDPNARVQQVTREAAELRRQLDATQREVERLKASRAEVPSGDDPKPRAADYPDTPEGADDYIEAKARWAARQERLAERQQEQKASEEHSTRAEREARQKQIETGVSQFHEKLREHIETDPEWEERVRDFAASHPPTWVLKAGETPGIANYLANDIIMNQPNPAEIMDHLAQNPDVLEDLEGTTNPRQFHRKLDAISLKLENEKPAPQIESEPSKARPPIKPVTGSAQVSDPYDLSDTLSDDEWMERRIALARKKRAG